MNTEHGRDKQNIFTYRVFHIWFNKKRWKALNACRWRFSHRTSFSNKKIAILRNFNHNQRSKGKKKVSDNRVDNFLKHFKILVSI